MNSLSFLIHTLKSPLIAGLAYLDPGSGSFILQLLLAALLGGLFLVKAYWAKIIKLFRGRGSNHEDDNEE